MSEDKRWETTDLEPDQKRSIDFVPPPAEDPPDESIPSEPPELVDRDDSDEG